MTTLPISPERSRTAAVGGDRRGTDTLRRVLLLLAVVLTVLAGPLGRTAADQPAEETFRPLTVASFTVAGADH